MKFSIIALLITLSPYVLHAQCGSLPDRWKAKTLRDGTTLGTTLTHTTVADQSALPRPATWGGKPRFPSERILVEIEGDIVMAGEEGDNDFHLVLKDGSKKMIVEIPSPDDCSEITTHVTEYQTARTNAESLLGTITGTGIHAVTPKHVKITGYGFFDKKNHGTGHSVNGREIHPVLSLVAN